MQLQELVATSRAIAATGRRTEKVRLLADLLRSVEPADVEPVVTWLGGSLRQRRTGVGWRQLSDLPAPAGRPLLTVSAVETLLGRMAETAGPGSRAVLTGLLAELFGSATGDEQDWLRALMLGELRQGALDSVVLSAVAEVSGVALQAVRRAAMMAGGTAPVASALLAAGAGPDAAAAAAGFGLQVGRPVLPMLASASGGIGEAITKALGGRGGTVVVDSKLDGIRLQAHRHAGKVLLVTRSLDDITARLPEVVSFVVSLPGGDLILDGEALVLDGDARPSPFQDTAARTGSGTADAPVTPFFFDLLHLDGHDLIDRPLSGRLALLDALVPGSNRTRRIVTTDVAEAEDFAATVLDAGHEGVIVKDPLAAYEAGRRGSAWVKVKPVHTLDLVVLAVEPGSGRRQGWLSNIHLGARDPSTPGGFVMVGKTFKGMTDEMLRWQTRRFRELSLGQADGWVTNVRPEQVVEVAVDGVQRSPRYPGGVALRFARVVRYRQDKTAEDADTIEDVRSLGRPGGGGATRPGR